MSVSRAHVQAVLIDLDGTLMDTAPDIAAAANAMRIDVGLVPLHIERIAEFVGKGTDVLVHRAITDDPDGQLAEAEFQRGRTSFHVHYERLNGSASRVFDGVPAALAQLRAAGLKLACVTNKPKAFTLPLLAGKGLTSSFDAIVAGDEVPRRKPHPDVLLEAAKRLGVPIAAAIMIGDSGNDLEAAHAAGIRAILVEGGYTEGEPLSALAGHAGLDAIVDDILAASARVMSLASLA